MNNKIRFWTGEHINELQENQIFVFGSNPEGRHGHGAAKSAMKFGATYGVGRGLSGQTYALVTKNLTANFTEKATGITYATEGFNSLSPEQITKNIQELYETAKSMTDKLFIVVYQNETWPNGRPKKSLNGYTGEEMWNMFMHTTDIPANVIFHSSFKPLVKLDLTKNNEPVDPRSQFTFFFTSVNEFSQWHPAKFVYKDITFFSTEQFMMYSKAKLFKDEEVAQKILDMNNLPVIKEFLEGTLTAKDIINTPKTLEIWNEKQKQVKALGRDVKGYIEAVWLEKRVPIVSVGNREKFNQNEDLKRKLMNTKGTRLVEASPYDKIWGIGLKATDVNAIDPSKWKGLNLLGDLLTNLRVSYEQELKPLATPTNKSSPRKNKP